ncbi:hypothetical protein DPMN_181051 [Dreissena polymorpha]|uniref:Uncharacterized protein n=1 Tax=Dreissena polymorpha TaxID=45954 RepID=A0A9D4DCY1_DREPO|nr:hypothetical protein DPMN_181051 [Dreissena polymorpha]
MINVPMKFHDPRPSVLELSSGNHLVDGPTDGPTNGPTDMCKTIYPLFFEGGHKNAPPPGGHVFQPTGIIFNLVQDIIGMNLLTKFHEDQTINVASRVKNAPPLGSHVFQANTKFHEDWTITVASRVLTRQMLTPHDA